MEKGRQVRLLMRYKQYKIGHIGIIEEVINEQSSYILLGEKNYLFIHLDMKDIYWEFF